MYGEERCRRPRDTSIEDARGQPPECERDTHVQHEAAGVYGPRCAVSDRPFERKAKHRDRAVVTDTILWWPVRLAHEPPGVPEIMQPRVVLDDPVIIAGIGVGEDACRGDNRKPGDRPRRPQPPCRGGTVRRACGGPAILPTGVSRLAVRGHTIGTRVATPAKHVG